MVLLEFLDDIYSIGITERSERFSLSVQAVSVNALVGGAYPAVQDCSFSLKGIHFILE